MDKISTLDLRNAVIAGVLLTLVLVATVAYALPGGDNVRWVASPYNSCFVGRCAEWQIDDEGYSYYECCVPEWAIGLSDFSVAYESTCRQRRQLD